MQLSKMSTSSEINSKITGNVLKVIAMISMLIDHTAAAIIDPMIDASSGPAIEILSIALHLIGRLAFPIFIFLLVEGFCHTKSIGKYILRMGIFAVISEIPFDLCIRGEIFAHHGSFAFSYLNNVFFTLTLALITLWIIDLLFKSALTPILRYTLTIVSVIVISLITLLIGSDYAVIGIIATVVMYLLRQNRGRSFVVGTTILCIASIDEAFAFLAYPVIKKYNGQRGSASPAIKYAAYLFYPLHLIILWALRIIL